MKKTRYLIRISLFASLIALSASCNKNDMNNDTNGNILSFVQKQLVARTPVDFSIDIISDNTFSGLTGLNKPSDFKVAGYFDGTTGVNGMLDVNGCNIPINNNSFYLNSSNDTNMRPIFNSYFGNDIYLKGNNSVIGNFYISNFYVPKVIKPILQNNTSLSIGGFDVKWVTDPNNAGNDVVVMVLYNPNHNENNGMNARYPNYIQQVYQINEQIGYCQVGTNELARFPIGSVIDIYISRGNEKIFDINGKSVRVLGMSISSMQNILLTR